MSVATTVQKTSEVGDQRQKVSFGKLKEDSFQKDVKKNVDQYFMDKNIATTANGEMILKTIFILSGWALTYFLIIFNMISPWAMFALALLHGFFTALIGLNVGHDAIHGSYTKNAGINKKIGLFFNLIGANDYVWSLSHNVVHHTYTNIPDMDEDIKQVPILRIDPKQELWAIHRFQHIYAFFLYSLTSITWVFIKDYKKFFQHQLGAYYRTTFPKNEMFRLFAYKAIYYAIFVVTPFIMIDLPWTYILMGFVAAHLVEGLTLAVIFMLAHVVEGTDFPEPDKEGKIDLPWADFQLHTTSNFAIKNKVVNYLFGGLNFQVEHHLFPKVCHVHYPAISSIVRDTAHAHNLPYLEHETFFGALASHARVLKKFGKS